MITVTRKIQILFDVEDKAQLKEAYQKVYGWQRICHKAANWIATHQYLQSEIQNLHYLAEGIKLKLADMKKDADGILTCSRDNTTYQVLSRAFKGECPMGMLSGLNTVVCKAVKDEIQDIRMGKKSLRTYRDNIPMPVRKADISNWQLREDGNYSFFVYGTQFKTNFGRDLSGNAQMLKMALDGINGYKLCDSSLQLKGNKMFLLTVFQFPETPFKGFDIDKEAEVFLDPDCPIRVKEKSATRFFEIGSKDQYLNRRIAIRGSMHRLQRAMKYSKGGKGRTKKLAALERLQESEANYVNTLFHTYSSQLVKFCLENRIGKVVLMNASKVAEDAKQTLPDSDEPLLRSWSFGNLQNKIVHKCAKQGIEVVKN